MKRRPLVVFLLSLTFLFNTLTVSAETLNQELKLPLNQGKSTYQLTDKDGNYTKVSFSFNPGQIEVIVQPPDGSAKPPKIIKIPTIEQKRDKDRDGDNEKISQPSSAQNNDHKAIDMRIPGYNDITKHWARDDIMGLSLIGIMKGYPDGTFRPDNPISKAEFAALLERAILYVEKTSLPVNKQSSFLDVRLNTWYYSSINSLEKRGNISVKYYPSKILNPSILIPRQEMAWWLSNEVENTNKKFSFIDSNQIQFYDDVQKVVAANLLKGYPDKSFRPNGATTRAEAASIIVRWLREKRFL